jgi:hypothetical protein
VSYRSIVEPLPELEERILEVHTALVRLQARIEAACPGPHVYVKFRDDRPPTCRACGFTDVGLHGSEFGHGR